MILGDQGDWHYMTKTGVLKEIGTKPSESAPSQVKTPGKQ